MQSLMNLLTSRGRRDVLSLCASVLFTAACSDVTLEPGTGGSAATGSTSSTTSTSAPTSTSTSTSSGPPMTACEIYCDTDPSCGTPAPDCVQICEDGTNDMCEPLWDKYSACMGEHFDAATCKYQFHACEAEATAVGQCLNGAVCYTDCDETAGGCNCTDSCVGDEWTWDCTMSAAGGYDCACTHDGVATGTCNGATAGTCESGALLAFCCLET